MTTGSVSTSAKATTPRRSSRPFLHVSEGYEHLARAEDYRLVPGWLQDAYPTLFQRPHLAECLVVYGISYDVRDLLEEADSGFGRLTFVRHAANLSETPPRWSRPSVPLGTHPPAWPG